MRRLTHAPRASGPGRGRVRLLLGSCRPILLLATVTLSVAGVTGLASTASAQMSPPLTIAPTTPVEGVPQPHYVLAINQDQLVGSNSWGAWFGAAPRRTLLLTISNTGDLPAVSPPLVLSIGRGVNSSRTVASPDLGTLPPGTTRTYQIPITLPVLSFGSYIVGGRLGPAGQSTGFTTTTSSWPWGFIAVAIVLVQLMLLWIRSLIREFVWMRELRRSIAATSVAEGSVPTEVKGMAGRSDVPPPERPSPSADGRAPATKPGLPEVASSGAAAKSTGGLT